MGMIASRTWRHIALTLSVGTLATVTFTVPCGAGTGANADDEPHALVFDSPEETAGLTPADCLACHEPSAGAGDTATRSGHTWQEADGQIRSDHPYDVRYQPTPRNGLRTPAELVPASGARVSDLLQDGRMHCKSCHAMYRSASLPGSRLLRTELGAPKNICVACHRM